MKKHPTLGFSTPVRYRFWPQAALLAWMASCQIGYAQQIVAPIDTSVDPSLTNQSVPASVRRAEARSAPASIRTAPISPLQWGPFDVRPHVIYRILYSDGLQVTPGHSVSTTINSFSPGVLVEFGTHWTFDYTPTWNEYSSREFRDTLDHTARLAWGTTYESWVLHASQDYSKTTAPLVQTGQQTRETDHITTLDGSFLFASNLIAETVLTRSSRLVENFSDTRDWSALEFFHIKVSPDLDSALGIKYSEIKTSGSPDMYYVQFLARVAWQVTEKLDLEIQGGLETRYFRQAGVGSRRRPIGNAAVHYQPFETTHLSFTTSRDTSVSYFSNQIVDSSRYGILLEQRLLTHFRLSAGAERQESSFRSTVPSAPVGRKDKTDSFTASLRTAVFRRVDVTFLYRRSRNESNIAGFSFSSGQVGLELGYRY